MKWHILILALVLSLTGATLQAEPSSAPDQTTVPSTTTESNGVAEAPVADEEAEYLAWAKRIWDSLNRQQGEIQLPNGKATLKVPEEFYYLNPGDAEKVLVEVWGNPPGQESLGMLFPADQTPFDDAAWAVTIDYEEEGYVSDSDADEIDYNELLTSMREETRLASEERVKTGYEAIELVGWAAPPFYDKTSHKLHWAKEIKFGDGEEGNTLNYNIRVLGRQGVLVLNFIAGMNQKALIEQQLPRVLAMAEFNGGSRYDEFNPDIDQVAAYGLGALVAGKVAAKAGLFAAALIFLKKFGVIIFIALGGLFSKLFKRKEKVTE
jgi:uncharacterized membrane-anchored protein